MDTTPTARAASRPRRRRAPPRAAARSRPGGPGAPRWPPRWAACARGAPGTMDPLHLWLVLLLVAITLASGLATLAQYFRWA